MIGKNCYSRLFLTKIFQKVLNDDSKNQFFTILINPKHILAKISHLNRIKH